MLYFVQPSAVGISVVMFGTSQALQRVRALALEHDLATLLLPPDVVELDTTIRRAMSKAV